MITSEEKQTIIISIPTVWAIRNFILSGILSELEKRYRVVVASSESCGLLLKKYEISDLLIVNKVQIGKFSGFIFSILQKAFSKKKRTISVNSVRNATINKNESLFSYVINSFSLLGAVIVNITGAFSLLEHFWIFLLKNKISSELQNKILSLKPVYFLSTTFALPEDRTIIFSCLKHGIKMITHIFSFDNITSRGYLPIRFFQKYMVWNSKMKEELVTLYNVRPESVVITGTPQFSFHLNETLKCSKGILNKSFGLPEDGNYFLYCANHFYHTPREPELLEHLITSVENVNEFSNFYWILRFHPLDNYNRWDKLIMKYPLKIKVSIPFSKFDNENQHLGYLRLKDLSDFSNLLRYSFVILSIASTIAIDAAVLDRPTFCIGFHPHNPEESNYYHQIHFSDHFKTIMEFNASPLTNTVEELKGYLKQLTKKDLWVENRKSLIDFLFGDTLTKSKALILDQL